MKAPFSDRMYQLEQTVGELTRRIEHAESQRQAEAVPPVSIRLARTWTADEGDYPTDHDTHLYPFVFLDAVVADPTYTSRSAAKQGDALWPQKRYLPRETIITVGEDRNGVYFINQAWTGATIVEGTLATNLAASTATVDIANVEALNGFPPELTDGKLNIENRFAFAGNTGDLVAAMFDDKNQAWFAYQMKCSEST